MISTTAITSNLARRAFLSPREVNYVRVGSARYSSTTPMNTSTFVPCKDDKNSPLSPSTLYVSGKYGNKILSVLRPKLNLGALIADSQVVRMKDSLAKRNALKDEHLFINEEEIDQIFVQLKNMLAVEGELEGIKRVLDDEKKEIAQQISLGRKFEDLDAARVNELKAQFKEKQSQLWDLEEELIPVVLRLPNVLQPNVPLPGDELVLREKKAVPRKAGDNKKQLFKILDHVKLSYINESVYSSIVGPDSVYHLGQSAQLHIALTRSLAHILRRNNFVDVSGLDFIKSAVIEATSSREERDYDNDPLRIDRGYDGDLVSQQLHLVGDGSLEALSAILLKLLPQRNLPLTRLMSVGSNYEPSSQSSTRSMAAAIRQHNAIRTLSAVNSAEAASKEIDCLLDLLWPSYEHLNIPCRTVMANSSEVRDAETAALKIEVWLPSQHEWLEAARISNYSNYLSRRLGMREHLHLVGSSALNARNVVSAIIENCQDEKGKIVIPESLVNFVL